MTIELPTLIKLIKSRSYTEATRLLNADNAIRFSQKPEDVELQLAINEAYSAHVRAIWERNTADIWDEYDLDPVTEEFENEPLVDLIVTLIKVGVDFSKVVGNGLSSMAILKRTSLNLYQFLQATFGVERIQALVIEPPIAQPVLPKTLEEAVAKQDWASAIHFIKLGSYVSDDLQEDGELVVIEKGSDIASYLSETSEYLQTAAINGYQRHLDRINDYNSAAFDSDYNLDIQSEEFEQEPIVDFIVLLLEKGVDFAKPLANGKSAMAELKSQSSALYNFLRQKFGIEIIDAMISTPEITRNFSSPKIIMG